MKNIVDYIAGNLEISNKFLLEKDILLHKILLKFSKSTLKDHFAFKGGTCLTKCYLGYYRFSEDLDFTYIDQTIFMNKSQKEIRRMLSKKIGEFAVFLLNLSREYNLEFQVDKSDSKYVEIGRSNKFVTFKLWYQSSIILKKQFVKIQINFIEVLFYKMIMHKALSLSDPIAREISFLYPEHKDLSETPLVLCYDIMEILLEKARAILTRKEIKARDFIDIYFILKKEKNDINSLERKIIEKTRFMLQYSKYLHNLSEFNIGKFVFEEEEMILLKPIDKGFKLFMPEFVRFLENIALEVKAGDKTGDKTGDKAGNKRGH